MASLRVEEGANRPTIISAKATITERTAKQIENIIGEWAGGQEGHIIMASPPIARGSPASAIRTRSPIATDFVIGLRLLSQTSLCQLINLLDQFRSEEAPSLKDMLGKLVPRIDVENGQMVYRAINLPLVFIMDCWVVPTDHKTNQLEMCSDLLDVSWTSRCEEPEAIARRSEIQRSRHVKDPSFHETALRNLEKGRLGGRLRCHKQGCHLVLWGEGNPR